MQLTLNKNMQYIDTDDGLVVLNNELQVHYIESTGKKIINMIATESDSNAVFMKICKLYPDVNREQLNDDFVNFIDKLISKGIIIYGI